MFWLLGSKSQLSVENKLLLYNSDPQTYLGFQLWGTASNSNVEILERFQNLGIIVNALHDLNMSCVRNKIKSLRQRYADRKNIPTYSRLTFWMKQVKTRRLKRRLSQENYLKTYASVL